MPRATDGGRRKTRRKKILDQAKGYWGRRSKVHRTAKDAVAKAGLYAYRDRRAKKRDFRKLWIARISAACRQEGMTYSRFMEGLKKADIELNRKVLSNMAIEDPMAFKSLVDTVKKTK
jgi:large subunit ribosomal protein L20